MWGSVLDSVLTLSLAASGAQAKRNLAAEQSDAEEKTREFRAALNKARSDALACRALASALQEKLDQADISGLQVGHVSHPRVPYSLFLIPRTVSYLSPCRALPVRFVDKHR